MEVADLEKLFVRARELTNHDEFVVVGSNSILGAPLDGELPARMTMSNDVDAYTKRDPGRIHELVGELGQESEFAFENGFYLEPVSPELPTLPAEWEARLYKKSLGNGITVYFLDPNDAAVSKYARSEPRDREWLQAGLKAGVLSPAVIEYRMRETVFFDDAEGARALAAFAEDKAIIDRARRRK